MLLPLFALKKLRMKILSCLSHFERDNQVENHKGFRKKYLVEYRSLYLASTKLRFVEDKRAIVFYIAMVCKIYT